MMKQGRVSRAAATSAALAVIAISAPARAQESDPTPSAPAQSGDLFELQFGGGYLFRDADLASLPTVEIGVVRWLSQSWGFSLRRSTTVGEHMASYDYRDGTRTGGRNFRHWTGTLRYRRALSPTLELNLGAGLTTGAYDHLTWYPGARPDSPEVRTQGGVGGPVAEVLVGRRIAPRLSIKAGFAVYPFLNERTAVVPIALGVVSF